MKKALLVLFVVIVGNVFAQHPCTPPTVIINLPPGLPPCYGDTIQLSASVHGGNSPFTYLWEPTGATTSSAAFILDNVTTITVKVKNACGDSAIDSVMFNVKPINLFACCDSIITPGDSMLLKAEGNVVSYQWSPPVYCLNPTCDSVWASPLVSTVYTITGTDSNGCQAQRTVTVLVGATGIPSLSSNNFIKIYPNPSSSVFTFLLTTQSQVKICDVTGRLLFSEMEKPGTITFGRELNPGIYFLFINGKPAGKLIKQ